MPPKSPTSSSFNAAGQSAGAARRGSRLSLPGRCPRPAPARRPRRPRRWHGAGRGGGAGLPLGTAVAQSISPKPRNFFITKKERKKKPQRPPSSLPPRDSRDWLCGLPGGGSGLDTQARVAEPARPSARPALGCSPPPSPPCKPPEVAFPDPGPAEAWAAGVLLGPGGGGAAAAGA